MIALPHFASSFFRRHAALAFVALGLSLAQLLTACGSGSTFEPLVPTRVISFGDGLSDLGQTGSKFTVNDGTVNIWVERVAVSYALTATAAVSGGLGFAQGNARIDTGVNSIAQQITTFLSLPAASSSLAIRDLVLIDAGVAELSALAQQRLIGTLATDDALYTAADAAGRAMAVQVRRLLAAGGKHVVILNAPDLGKTPFATANTLTAVLTAATTRFNLELKLALADQQAGNLLYLDNQKFVNELYSDPTLLGTGGISTIAACPGLVTSCNAGNAAASYNLYIYADDRHLTPGAQRYISDRITTEIKNRW